MIAAQPSEAVGLVIAAAEPILDMQISGAVSSLSTAVLHHVTLPHSGTTCGTVCPELTVLTALPLPTVCTISQHTCGGIAAWVLTLL